MLDEAKVPPKIALVVIEDELFYGETLDVNSATIAKVLGGSGFQVEACVFCLNKEEETKRWAELLLKSNDVLAVIGGPGVEFSGKAKEKLMELLGSRGRKKVVVERAAQTLILDAEGKTVIFFPQAPTDVEGMLKASVIPHLRKKYASFPVAGRKITAYGASQSEIEHLLSDISGKDRKIKYEFISLGELVEVRISISPSIFEGAEEILDEEEKKTISRLGNLFLGKGEVTMEGVLGDILVERNLTIATCESVTAGLVCSRIANIAGSSRYLLGGLVTYSIESKQDIAGISKENLSHGAVNEKVAGEMAMAVRRVFKADIGISTTGVAGPSTGGEREKPGTVFIGLSDGKEAKVKRIQLLGNRAMVRNSAASWAMNFARLHLLGKA